jgi:NusA-like KH domain protein
MVNILDMKDIMYLNLFSKITRVNTRFCFMYNDNVIFAVPRNLISKAVGENGRNVKKLNEVLRKKIKIIPIPHGIEQAREFIYAVISPTTFKGLEVTENEIIINAGSQNKAALIGRNKRRFLELQIIIKDFFKKELKII